MDSVTGRTIDVLIVGGTWNADGGGVTAAFADGLDRSVFAPRMIPYPADYGQRVPFEDSVAVGRAALIAAIEESPNPVVVAGYSQGAAVAGAVAAAVGRGELPHLEVVGCALIADPLRPRGCFVGDVDPGGYGILGERDIGGMPVWWAAAPGDPITALPAGNPLRSIADLSGMFCLSGVDAGVRWAREMIAVAARRQLQRWWSPANWQSWGGAIAFARGYLFDGRHTVDYVRYWHCARLAEEVNRVVVTAAR